MGNKSALKEIPGFPFQYISEDGHLVSFYKKLYEPACFVDRDGYKRYPVYNANGKRVGMAAHRLVYAAYVGQLVDGLSIDHSDNDKKNNHYTNLVQMSHADNTRKEKKGKSNPRKNRKLSAEDIEKCFLLREKGYTYPKISTELGMSPSMSWHIIKGKTYYDISGVTHD